MRFGQRAEDVEESKPFIRNLKKGETKVRFLQEIGDWIQFREHYSMAGRSFPCTRESDCPGCNSPVEQVSRWSRKYAANVLMTSNGQVAVIKIPVTLYNRMQTRYERNGNTVTNRDYTLLKSGEGLSTEYDVEQEEKYAIDLKQYELFDIEQMLAEQFELTLGTDDISTDGEKPVDGEQVIKLKSAWDSRQAAKADLDVPPTKPQPEQDDEAEEILTDDELKAMNVEEMLHVAEASNLVVPEELVSAGTKQDLLQFLMDNL